MTRVFLLTPTVLVVVQMGRRRVYQLNSDHIWFRWRGKRGWWRVRNTNTLVALRKFEP